MGLERGRSQRKSERGSKSWRGESSLKLEAEQSGERDDRNEREHERTATELKKEEDGMEYDRGREQIVQ